MAKAPDLTQRHTPRDFDVVLGCCLALMLTVVLSLSLFYSRDVLNRLEQLQSARSDNVQWTLTQVEVEHLSFLNALELPERLMFYASNGAVAMIVLGGFALIGAFLTRILPPMTPKPR